MLLVAVGVGWALSSESGEHAAVTTTVAAPTNAAPASPAGTATSPTTTALGGDATTVPVTPQRILPVRTAVTGHSPSAEDCGAAVTYGPENFSDGIESTAWEVPGNGVGHGITFNLGGSTHVTQVGLVPGYDKVQPCDARVDRYFQNFRVSRVRWRFDDGTSIEQDLDVSQRAVQYLPVDETTVRVSMDIVATVPGTEVDVDTAISEIEVVGAAP